MFLNSKVANGSWFCWLVCGMHDTSQNHFWIKDLANLDCEQFHSVTKVSVQNMVSESCNYNLICTSNHKLIMIKCHISRVQYFAWQPVGLLKWYVGRYPFDPKNWKIKRKFSIRKFWKLCFEVVLFSLKIPTRVFGWMVSACSLSWWSYTNACFFYFYFLLCTWTYLFS